MKKLVMILFIVILSACSSNEAGIGIKEVNQVPNEVKETIDINRQLQLNNAGENEYYIIFHSDGKVTANFEEEEEKAIIKFDIAESKTKETIENVYYLRIAEESEKIIVLINGEPTAFDLVEA